MGRIGLIQSEDYKKGIVNFIGFGEYVGDFDKESTDFPGMSVKMAKIKLDNDKELWLDEIKHCLFADEESINEHLEKRKLEGYQVRDVL